MSLLRSDLSCDQLHVRETLYTPREFVDRWERQLPRSARTRFRSEFLAMVVCFMPRLQHTVEDKRARDARFPIGER
jgi:hypothetical protein